MNLLTGITLLMLGACASRPKIDKYQVYIDSFVGTDINERIVKNGPPTKTFEMPNGSTIYTWDTEGAPKTIETMGMWTVSTRVEVPVCTTNFFVGKDQKISQATYQGKCYAPR